MERRVLISPIGLEFARILDGIGKYPSEVIYLLRDEEQETDDLARQELISATRSFSESLQRSIQYLNLEVHELTSGVQLSSAESCIKILKTIISNENTSSQSPEFFINVSTATKNFALAAYLIAAYFQPTIIVHIFYLRTSNYTILKLFSTNDIVTVREEYKKNGSSSGPFTVEEIPVFPLAPVTSEMAKLLTVLQTEVTFPSIGAVLSRLVPGFETWDLKSQKSTRMRYNYVLRKLERLKLVGIQKQKHNFKIALTETGKLFCHVLV